MRKLCLNYKFITGKVERIELRRIEDDRRQQIAAFDRFMNVHCKLFTGLKSDLYCERSISLMLLAYESRLTIPFP